MVIQTSSFRCSQWDPVSRQVNQSSADPYLVFLYISLWFVLLDNPSPNIQVGCWSVHVLVCARGWTPVWKYSFLCLRNTTLGGNNFLSTHGQCLLVSLAFSSPHESLSLTTPLQAMSPACFWCLSDLPLVFNAMLYLDMACGYLALLEAGQALCKSLRFINSAKFLLILWVQSLLFLSPWILKLI